MAAHIVMLAWSVSCCSVSNEIVTTSPAFGQIEPGLVYKNKNVGLFHALLTPWFSTKKHRNKIKLICIIKLSKYFLFLWVSKTSSNTGILELQKNSLSAHQ